MPENNQPSPAMSAPPESSALLSQIEDALKTVYDPEIPVSIYELGLIYDLKIEPPGDVKIKMTLTAPSCPEAMSLPGSVESVVKAISGVTAVNVELVWEPPWSMSKMSDAAKLKLGML